MAIYTLWATTRAISGLSELLLNVMGAILVTFFLVCVSRCHGVSVCFLVLILTRMYVCVVGTRCSDVLKAVEILLTSYRLRKSVYLRCNQRVH